MADIKQCFICKIDAKKNKYGLEVPIEVKEKSINTMISHSQKRRDGRFAKVKNIKSLHVHKSCQLQYTSNEKTSRIERNPEKYTTQQAGPSRRSKKPDVFDYSTKCFLCAKACNNWKKRRIICYDYTQGNILEMVKQRDDDWGKEVLTRIENVESLKDLRARYHPACCAAFSKVPSGKQVGRPPLTDLEAAFDRVCTFLEENEECQFLLPELLDEMKEYQPSPQILEKKLLSKYGERIVFHRKFGCPTVICFQGIDYDFLKRGLHRKKYDTEKQEIRALIKAAAAATRNEIRSKAYDLESYPCPHNFLENVVDDIPETLGLYLSEVMLNGKKGELESYERKRDSIAHAIISVARPRSFLSSILLGTAVYLHRKWGSKLIIDMLSSLGYCSTYQQVTLFESSAVLHSKVEINEEAFVQYVFDNADHNVCTLDGYKTFHSMGGICCVTPKESVVVQRRIEKLKIMPSEETLSAKAKFPVTHYVNTNGLGLKNLVFEELELNGLQESEYLPITYGVLLFARAFLVENLPNWKGYLEKISTDIEYQVSRVLCLPFLDLPPSSKDAINSVLCYAANECEKRNQICMVTCDQPLYIKVKEILAEGNNPLLKNTKAILGGFHLGMSAVGGIGTIMAGSGLKELWSVIYASNTTDKMLMGHAWARAVRAHLLTYQALGVLIIQGMTNIDDTERQYLINFFGSETPVNAEKIDNDQRLILLVLKLQERMYHIKNRGRTAKLWIQYMNYVNVLMLYMQAQRLGNWQLHLRCVRELLPLFHAAGHLNYAKSAHLYLQDMLKLEEDLEATEHHCYTDLGYFTIRRTDKVTAGNFTDMTIEQTLMRTSKSVGGISRGRGVAAGVLSKFILGMPTAYEVIDQMEEFCGVKSTTTEQHVDLSPSRIQRDAKDCAGLVEWLESHDPFPITEELRSISTGMVATSKINCDQAAEVGQNSMKAMTGISLKDLVLKRSNRVQPLAAVKNGIEIDGEIVTINSSLFFQRIIVLLHRKNERETIDAFRYELAPFPMALFDNQGFMRKPAKSKLYDSLKYVSDKQFFITGSKFVIDGGFLLHKMIWPPNSTFRDIIKSYVQYVRKHYSWNYNAKHPTVVFDGYEHDQLAIKNYERLRRMAKHRGAEMTLAIDMIPTLCQSSFLSSDKNKCQLIELLAHELENANIAVKKAIHDADGLIVKTAIAEASNHDKVIIVGEDVDLCVLMIGLTPIEQTVYLLKPGRGKVPDRIYSSQDNSAKRDTILFAHAFTGCDSTSAIHFLGKNKICVILKNRTDLHDYIQVFYDGNASTESVINAGKNIILALYGASKEEDDLDEYRYKRFEKSVMNAQVEVFLAKLPPTMAAASQHFRRVYFQIQEWLNPGSKHILDWGWKLTQSSLIPTMTTLKPAPDELLRIISCKCKGPCGKACGCRKSGLRCSPACLSCQGTSCTNKIILEIECEDYEEDDDNHTQEVIENPTKEDIEEAMEIDD